MFSKKNLKLIALIVAAVLCLGTFASCASNNDDELNSVTGPAAGNLSTGNKETAGNGDQQDNTDNKDDNSGNEQSGTETPGGNGQSGTDDPDTPVTSTPDAGEGEEENDPYAAMKADTSGTKLSFLTINIRYDAIEDRGGSNDVKVRRHRFKKLVEKYDPDVICVQEGCETWLEIFPEDLSEYDMYYHGAERDGRDEYSPVLWKRDKYTKTKEGYFWVSDTPDQYSPCFHNALAFIVNWVELKDNATGQIFRVFSTHFGFDLTYEESSRMRQIYKSKIADMTKDGYAFIMGDLNFPYQSMGYLALMDEVTFTDLRDVATAMSENGHCTLGEFRGGTPSVFEDPNGGSNFIDHVMALPRKDLAVDFYGILYDQFDGYVSDHFPVYVEVRMNTDVSYAEYYADSAT